MNRTFSEEDAQRIFALAVERQQRAQVEVKPQLSLTDLEEAGQAAGIDPAHIRAAAADLLRPDRIPAQRFFWGMPVEIRRTQVFSSRIDAATRQRLLAAVRHTFGTEGVLTELKNGFAWASAATENYAPVRVFVEDEGTGSRVTFERNKWNQVFGIGMGMGTFFIMFLVIMLSALSSGDSEQTLIGAIFTVAALLVGAGSFYGLRRQGYKEIDEFNTLMAQVEAWLIAAPADVGETTPAPSVDVDVEGYVMGKARPTASDKRTRSG